MKKYLITGALALVACATLTSCHSDDELSGSLVQQKIKAYEQVFEEEFGKVDPNQDWGFGTAELLARTRTAMARTRADNANANEWANDWIVPQQLTPAQKLRVTRYFQTHKNPGSTPNYGNKNFFVQQVYDGATDPITNLEGFSAPTYSTETYVPGNGEPINSGEHMDHLTAGPAVEGNGHHILNFNNSTYGTDGEPNHDVSNSTGVDYYEWEGWGKNTNYENTHSDQIQLMLNHATYPWGYEDSSDSHLYTDCWTLVSAATIDAWANSDEAKALGIELGDPVSTDGWNRDFIGFDFSLLNGDDLYSTDDAKYEEALAEAIWVWDGEKAVKYITGRNNDWSPIFAEGYDGYIYKGTNKIKYLSDKLNQYCVELKGFDNITADNVVYYNDWAKQAAYDANSDNDDCVYITGVTDEDGNPIKDEYGNDTKALNLVWLNKILGEGYLPVAGKGMKLWGKPTGCRDGYYSDWIVSFMPATPVNGQEPGTTTIPIEPGSEGSDYTQDLYFKMVTLDKEGSGRVFCEDLGVVSASDIDFNDIVFDVLIYKTEYLTRHMKSTDNVTWTVVSEEPTREATYNGDVWLLAGGGTIPATIQIPKAGISGDLKDLLSPPSETLTTKIIVNTIENDEGRYGNPYRNDIAPKKINSEPLAITTVKDVKIFVTYGAEFAELTAYKGAAPHKICVPLNTKWLKERAEISKGYPLFTNYVKYKDADGNSLTDGPGATFDEEGNQIGDGDQNPDQNWTERVESTWKQTDQDYLYPLAIPYTPRTVDVDWQPDGQSDVTPGGAGSGYNSNNDPVLIRRRH